GVLDFIGAARPSIADPFLPRKIETGDVDDIRECIGCNVCVSGDYTMTPIRCTQNPTMGEEWRKGWHPEAVPPRSGEDSFLIVGAGPAGLECARMLGRRGYSVHVAEAREASVPAGSVVSVTSRLPNDELYETLLRTPEAVAAAGIVSISSIGDCLAPGTIAAAVYAGHRYAREFDLSHTDQIGFRRELPH